MGRDKTPVTAAVRQLRAAGIQFSDHPYAYEKRGGTAVSARVIGVKTIQPCDPDTANSHTGYRVGGISLLGIRKSLPIYLERTILDLHKIYINGGKRGYLVGIVPGDLVQVLHPTPVSVAT